MNKSVFAKCIDVSRWQGSIDWKVVKASGIGNVMIRCSSWDNSGPCEDPEFKRNISDAYAAGLNVGVYHYSYAANVAEARREAKFVLELLAPYRLQLPVAFDFEDIAAHEPLSKRQATDIVKAFCDLLEGEQYYCVLYTFSSWMSGKFYDAEIAKYDKWVAHVGVSAPAYSGDYGIWQYSHTGQVAGIKGNVDLNYIYKDYPAIIKAAGLNGYERPKPTPQPEEPDADDWQEAGLDQLAQAGVIDRDEWAGRMEEQVTVGELLGLLGRMTAK